MEPQEIEDMLYRRAIHSKARPPVAQRNSSLACNRAVTGGVVAGAALVCTLAMPNSVASHPVGSRAYTGQSHRQLNDSGSKKQPESQASISPETLNSVGESLAMSHVGN